MLLIYPKFSQEFKQKLPVKPSLSALLFAQALSKIPLDAPQNSWSFTLNVYPRACTKAKTHTNIA